MTAQAKAQCFNTTQNIQKSKVGQCGYSTALMEGSRKLIEDETTECPKCNPEHFVTHSTKKREKNGCGGGVTCEMQLQK